MTDTALVIIDMQTALVEANPFGGQAVVDNILMIRDTCRKHEVPVIYVRHDGGRGDELEKGCMGWHIKKISFYAACSQSIASMCHAR